MISWTTKKVKVSNLKEYKGNPRTFTEKGIEDLKKSISKFGLAEPIVCNPDLTIIGGHARKKTLELLNIKEVIAYIPERELTPKEIKELNIRLNKNIAGEWNFDLLANEFKVKDLLDWGFENYELGISNVNIDDFFSDKLNEKKEKKEEEIKCPVCGAIFKK